MDYYHSQSAILAKALNLSDVKYVAAQQVVKALLKELCLSPKPGLVDRYNTGAHNDMDFDTFVASIHAITPWLDTFYEYGQSTCTNFEQDFLIGIRPIGIKCEQSMLEATHNINTHKGGIFAFGLLLGAMGRLSKQNKKQDYRTICTEVATLCRGMVDKELQQQNAANTKGEQLFKLHKLSGARGEAESGYSTVREISLPIFIKMVRDGYDEEMSLLQAMLYLLAYNQDTNLVARGGLDGLTFVQHEAKKLIKKGGVCHKNGVKSLSELDNLLIKNNLSPGGSADLIAVTWFLSHYQ